MGIETTRTFICDFCGCSENASPFSWCSKWRRIAIAVSDGTGNKDPNWNELHDVLCCSKCFDPGFDRKTQLAGRTELLKKVMVLWNP